ncbi:MAG: hypothetical protein A2W28_00055 [Gammaproteobacteria bacterium RBG_16_51_14]|nr:MAG: hypothetical protein A2W28_00055 [Gammaproteobacteria bacterium RBG_16_51_14]
MLFYYRGQDSGIAQVMPWPLVMTGFSDRTGHALYRSVVDILVVEVTPVNRLYNRAGCASNSSSG